MLRINVEIDEATLKVLVLDYLRTLLNEELTVRDVSFEVKTKKNYKAVWEEGAFRVRVDKSRFDPSA